MELTPQQQQLGKENFAGAISVSRREFLKGATAGAAGLGAMYFGYAELTGEPVRVGFIGTGDEGNILINEHPPHYMNIVAIADLRPSNQKRAIHGDGNDVRMGLTRKLALKRPQASRSMTTTSNSSPRRTNWGSKPSSSRYRWPSMLRSRSRPSTPVCMCCPRS